jgi:putative transposase
MSKYRYKVLRKPVVNMLMKDVLNNLAKSKNMFFYAMEVFHDHIHMFIEVPKNISIDYVIKYLKSQTARFMFLAFPGFRKRYPRGHFWSKYTYFESIGRVTEKVVRDYIEIGQSKHLQ